MGWAFHSVLPYGVFLMSELFQAQTYASPGPLDYNPDAAVAAGSVVVYGTTCGIVICDIPAGGPGALVVEGLFLVVKDTSVFEPGDAVYWNPTGNPVGGTAGSGCATSTPGANLMGSVPPEGGALTGDATVQVFLSSAERTATLAGSLGVDGITGTDSSLGISGLAAAQGGTVAVVGGTSSTGSNAGGAVSATGGTGGAAGAGGAASLVGGVPASGNAAGGAASVTGGAGSGTGAGGATAVAGGGSGTGATGNGGAAGLTGGAALSTNGTGGAASVTGGVATGTGTGGAATLRSGASAGAGGTAGAVVVDAGAAAGGTGAAVEIAPTNATGTKIGTGGSERALIKGINISGTIAVAVPSVTDPDMAKVDVDISAMTFAAAVGDAVIAIPSEALPTNCRLLGAWVSATDQVTITFGSEGGNVTGANKNFTFLLIDLT